MKIIYSFLVIAFLTGCSVIESRNEILESPKKQNVKVECNGTDFEDTKKICFKRAIQEAVGIALVANNIVADKEVVTNEIISTSSGFIFDYYIISKQFTDNKVYLTMDVVVRSSKIQDRIFGMFGQTEKIDGEKLTTQYETYMDERKSGDDVLNTVLADHPLKAFEVQKVNHAFTIDPKRNAILKVSFEINWNYNYLVALNEALGKAQDKKSNNIPQERIAIISKHPRSTLGETNQYFFSDSVRALKIKQQFVGPAVVIVKVYDWNNKVIISHCAPPIFFVGAFVGDSKSPYVIYGNDRRTGQVEIKVSEDEVHYKAFKEAQRIEVSISKGNDRGRCF